MLRRYPSGLVALSRSLVCLRLDQVDCSGIAFYNGDPRLRKYVSLNGDIADNIRPALYGARYEALVANKMDAEFAVLSAYFAFPWPSTIISRSVVATARLASFSAERL